MKFVYNSFNGRYADNPRSVFQALRAQNGDDEHVWLADPRFSGGFPAGVTTVPIASPGAVAALESADVLVANCHTDLDTWRKSPELVYLQTWHGTPLKRIHRAAVWQPGTAAMDALDAEIARWDILLSPSRAATGMLRSAFGYRGAVWEMGYPRNDALLAVDRDHRRAALRCELGIGEDTTAVLYAPTYRDDQVDEPELPLGLDPSALVSELGTSHVLWLRPHYYLSHQRRGPGTERVRDVSSYPDAADLYLAADVLVTDYSSAMFDFAVTGKPIIIYAYDLDHYRDRLRGFTFDLEDEGPGPVVRTQDQLVAALADLPGVAADTAQQYAAFRDRYCHLEDGRAAQRVAAALRHPKPRHPSAHGLLVPATS